MAEITEFSLDIVSATWGTTDVTAKLRSMYASDAKTLASDSNIFTITPTEAVFGIPFNMPKTPKLLVCVW